MTPRTATTRQQPQPSAPLASWGLCFLLLMLQVPQTAASSLTSRFALSVGHQFEQQLQSFKRKRITRTVLSSTLEESSRSLGPTEADDDDHDGDHVAKSSTSVLFSSDPAPSQSSFRTPFSVLSVFPRRRGGSAPVVAAAEEDAAAASSANNVKTMTSRQMEAFNLLSGGIAGTVASTLTNPLEVIKTQLQSSNSAREGMTKVARQVLQSDGPAGLFRGLPATLVGIIPARSIYFYAYQKSQRALAKLGGGGEDGCLKAGSPPNALLSGLFAGICGNTVTNPIWMVRTRMQLLADASAGQVNYVNYRHAIGSIWREEGGIAGFYKGVAASYWGCTEGALQFLLYEQLKQRLRRRQRQRRQRDAELGLKKRRRGGWRRQRDDDDDSLSEWTLFASAAVSKMVASILTYPHEVARTRLREQAKLGVFKYSGMWPCLRVIAAEEGRRGLYSGMGVHLLKVVPNSALMFLTYELVKQWLGEFQVKD